MTTNSDNRAQEERRGFVCVQLLRSTRGGVDGCTHHLGGSANGLSLSHVSTHDTCFLDSLSEQCYESALDHPTNFPACDGQGFRVFQLRFMPRYHRSYDVPTRVKLHGYSKENEVQTAAVGDYIRHETGAKGKVTSLSQDGTMADVFNLRTGKTETWALAFCQPDNDSGVKPTLEGAQEVQVVRVAKGPIVGAILIANLITGAIAFTVALLSGLIR